MTAASNSDARKRHLESAALHASNRAASWQGRCEELTAENAELRAEADRERRFAARIHGEVEAVLDRALGTDEADGTGEGLAADVALVVSQRDAARAEVERLRSVVAAVEAVIDRVDPTKSATVMTSAVRAAISDAPFALAEVRDE